MSTDLSSLIADWRAVIANSTPGPAVACYEVASDNIEMRPIVCLGPHHDGPLAFGDDTQGIVCLTAEDRDRIVVAWNYMPRFIDMVEAAAALVARLSRERVYRNDPEAVALDAAIDALAKEQSK